MGLRAYFRQGSVNGTPREHRTRFGRPARADGVSLSPEIVAPHSASLSDADHTILLPPRPLSERVFPPVPVGRAFNAVPTHHKPAGRNLERDVRTAQLLTLAMRQRSLLDR